MKRPRHYAQEIIKQPLVEDRRKMLEDVPAHYREWVEGYVRNHFELRKARLTK